MKRTTGNINCMRMIILTAAILAATIPARAGLVNGDFEATAGWGAMGDPPHAAPPGWRDGDRDNAAVPQSGSQAIGGSGTSAYFAPDAGVSYSQRKEIEQILPSPTGALYRCEFDFAVEDAGGAGDRSLNLSVLGENGSGHKITTNLRINGAGDVQQYDNSWTTILVGAVNVDDDVRNTPLVHHMIITHDTREATPFYDVEVVDSDGVVHSVSGIDLFYKTPQSGGGGAGLVFNNWASSGAFVIDNVTLGGLLPANPYPADGAANVSTDGLTLSWDPPAGGPYTYDVYLKGPSDADFVQVAGNQSAATYTPAPELEQAAFYSWRVDIREGGSVVESGEVWDFSTLGAGFFEQVDVFVNGTEGYACYRIPAIIAAPNGDILAFCEGRQNSCADLGKSDIVMKRSTDNGRTWEPLVVVYDEPGAAGVTLMKGCPVVDRSNNRLWLPFTRVEGDDYRVFIGYSDDSGYTWSSRTELTSSVRLPEWSRCATGAGVGIQLQNPPYAGRLVIPSDHNFSGGVHMMYSDDHGATWTIGQAILPGLNEPQAVELFDGTIMCNSRTAAINPDYRGIATSSDGGITWSELTFDLELPEPTCQASFLRFTRADNEDINRVLFSNPATTSSRTNMTVKLSYDEGETWPVAKQVYAGSSAYSCLVVMPDWTLGCFYEKDGYSTITLARFDLAWLTNGADSMDFRFPAPADGAVDVAQNALLSWTPDEEYDPDGGDSARVYLGTSEESLTLAGTVGTPVFDPDLEWQTSYVWQVEEIIDGTPHTGPRWSFSTTGERLCDPPLLADANEDCVVNMMDLFLMAGEWLEDTYPDGNRL